MQKSHGWHESCRSSLHAGRSGRAARPVWPAVICGSSDMKATDLIDDLNRRFADDDYGRRAPAALQRSNSNSDGSGGSLSSASFHSGLPASSNSAERWARAGGEQRNAAARAGKTPRHKRRGTEAMETFSGAKPRFYRFPRQPGHGFGPHQPGCRRADRPAARLCSQCQDSWYGPGGQDRGKHGQVRLDRALLGG